MLSNRDYSKVFYVSSHGMAGDHLFDWLPKALGSHPEIYTYMGESIRSKYLKERKRNERPDLLEFTNFLYDMCGNTYELVGELFSYRAYQLEEFNKNYNKNIRCVNLVRHPYAWLEHYVNWRVGNLNMEKNNTFAIDHEWNVINHDVFLKNNKLMSYTKDDVEVWSSYQGMNILNRMISDIDIQDIVKNITIESISSDKDRFNEFVSYISSNKIKFDSAALELIFDMIKNPFRENSIVIGKPELLRRQWPKWKKDAFEAIVNNETIKMFSDYGYLL